MKIDIAYGKKGLTIDVPEENLAKILRMTEKPVIGNPKEVIHEKISSPTGSQPLAEIAKGKKSACIVISDITRPVPNTVILPPVFEVLESSGIPCENITILIGTGIHRPNEGEELITLLGHDIPKKYHVVNHMGRDRDSHDYLGETPIYKAPIYVDKEYFKADLSIVTGLIEPHFMAGFSGGRKGIMPAICAFETVKVLHGPAAMAHEKTAGGVIEGNTVHQECLYVAKKTGVDFMVNVALNERREITGVFAGGLEEAHMEGVEFVRTQSVDTVDEPVDAVITTSAGFPLDLTFYQAVKGMCEAMPIVKPGGVIIIASECAEGIGSPEFTKLMLETDNYEDFLANIKQPGYYVLDQWEFQKLINVIIKHEVWLYSDGIEPGTQANLFVKPLGSIEEGIAMVKQRFGDDAKIAVIPEGPYVTARLA